MILPAIFYIDGDLYTDPVSFSYRASAPETPTTFLVHVVHSVVSTSNTRSIPSHSFFLRRSQ